MFYKTAKKVTYLSNLRFRNDLSNGSPSIAKLLLHYHVRALNCSQHSERRSFDICQLSAGSFERLYSRSQATYNSVAPVLFYSTAYTAFMCTLLPPRIRSHCIALSWSHLGVSGEQVCDLYQQFWRVERNQFKPSFDGCTHLTSERNIAGGYSLRTEYWSLVLSP
jgi:hypothetical protein